jgi:DNA-directed RNA polymerase specialized sigma24 family protein
MAIQDTGLGTIPVGASDVTEPLDAALWLEATSGMSASFGAIYDRHKEAVFRHAYGRTTSVSAAEEIVAIVFLEAWRRRDAIRFVDGSLLPWLIDTTIDLAGGANRTRRRHRRGLSMLTPALGDRTAV